MWALALGSGDRAGKVHSLRRIPLDVLGLVGERRLGGLRTLRARRCERGLFDLLHLARQVRAALSKGAFDRTVGAHAALPLGAVGQRELELGGAHVHILQGHILGALHRDTHRAARWITGFELGLILERRTGNLDGPDHVDGSARLVAGRCRALARRLRVTGLLGGLYVRLRV